jgi:hypothetical protein
MWWGDRFHSWGIVLMGGGSSLSSKSTLVAPARAAAMASDRSTLVRMNSATCGLLSARLRLSRASPTASAASTIFLHSPDTILSIAALTFFETRLAGVAAVSAGGLSRVAKARGAGVMFSISSPSALPEWSQRTPRDVFQITPV